MSDVKRIQAILGRLSLACERLEVLPRGRTELLSSDEPGLELGLMWLELLARGRQGGNFEALAVSLAESLGAEAVVVLSRATEGTVTIAGDLSRALGSATTDERATSFLRDLCNRRFATNLDNGTLAKVAPDTDVIAFLSVPISDVDSPRGVVLATRRRHSLVRRAFNERERLALTVAATALGLILR